MEQQQADEVATGGMGAWCVGFLRVGDLAAMEFALKTDPQWLYERLRFRGASKVEAAEARSIVLSLREDAKHVPGIFLRAKIEQGFAVDAPAAERMLPKEAYDETPRFPTGIPALDHATRGGVYGVVALGGSAGAGKSMLAAQIAVENALLGVRVVFFEAEMDERQTMVRLMRAAGPKFREIVSRDPLYPGPLVPIALSPHARIETLQKLIYESLALEDERLLVIVDSVNTVAESMGDEFEYFDAIRDISTKLALARRISHGKVGVILVSELNQRGDLKGAKLEFLVDLSIRVRGTGVSEICEIEVTKGREGGRGELGCFLVDWRNGKLVAQYAEGSR